MGSHRRLHASRTTARTDQGSWFAPGGVTRMRRDPRFASRGSGAPAIPAGALAPAAASNGRGAPQTDSIRHLVCCSTCP